MRTQGVLSFHALRLGRMLVLRASQFQLSSSELPTAPRDSNFQEHLQTFFFLKKKAHSFCFRRCVGVCMLVDFSGKDWLAIILTV